MVPLHLVLSPQGIIRRWAEEGSVYTKDSTYQPLRRARIRINRIPRLLSVRRLSRKFELERFWRSPPLHTDEVDKPVTVASSIRSPTAC